MAIENKRYQIFISSTYSDLKEERAEVTQAIMELNHMPYGMEAFPAANETQWTWIMKAIKESDYYIVIIAGKYGSINPKTGLSYTEMEYRYAEEVGVPTIAFLVDELVDLPKSKIETDITKAQKLKEFRRYIESTKLRKSYTTKDDLRVKVITSLMHLIKQCPRNGWIRTDSLKSYTSNDEVINLMKENDKLRKEINKEENLKQGDDLYRIHYSIEETGSFSNKIIVEKAYVDIEWNEIFEYIASFLYEQGKVHRIDMYPKNDLKSALAYEILKKVEHVLDYKSEEGGYKRLVLFILNPFYKILLQLEAVGYIAESSNGSWTLTKKGRKEYVIRKAEKKNN